MDENNRSMLGFYRGLMAEDPRFARQVHKLKNRLTAGGEGVRTSLFTPEELQKAKRHRKPQITDYAVQLGMWTNDNNTIAFEPDPERNIFNTGEQLGNRYIHDQVPIITKEVKIRTETLRNMIGLPVARGKDPHVKDAFYKFLVRRLVRDDIFEIFHEYDRVYTEIPSGLRIKIDILREWVGLMINGEIGLREKYKIYYGLIKGYEETGEIPKEVIGYIIKNYELV